MGKNMSVNYKKKEYTKEEIITIGESLLDKSFDEIAKTKEDLKFKGSFGHFIEKYVYGIERNNYAKPDFPEAGIELKVTPFKMNKDESISAKERLVLNIINYLEEAKKTFYSSSFWKKNAKLYILFYLWESNKQNKDFMIMFDHFLDFEQEDLVIIKRDWEIIHNKILLGKAHEISEADTMYLGACTKGVNRKSLREQYNSDILAKQRAYSLKTSYMTQLLRNKISGKDLEAIKLVSNALELEKKSFEEIIYQRLEPYFGTPTQDLISRFDLGESKNINEIIIARLLGVHGRLSSTDEFIKANIVPKTIRLEENGKLIESMSFPAFKYEKIVEESWDNSELKDYFETTKFMFVIFKKQGVDYRLFDIKFWNMPMSVLENEIKDVWLHTQSIVREGKIVKSFDGGKYATNFIKKSDNQVMHVRPHAKDGKDTFPLPTRDITTGKLDYTKHCFWLNNNYILSIINNKNSKS